MNTVNTKEPLVSVIIPVYNRKDLLPRTLKSIVNQTYKHLEILVIDDGSSEDIKSVADSFNDPRIRYFRHNRNKGVAAARNTGLKEAKGDFIAFLDSDDEYMPKKTEKQVSIFFENSSDNTGVVYCGIFMRREDSGYPKYRLNYPKFCKWNFFLQQILVKRTAVEKVGLFDTAFPQTDDTDFIFRLSHICNFRGIPEPLVVKYKANTSFSKNMKSCCYGIGLFLQKNSEKMTARERSHWLHSLAKNLFYSGEYVKGYWTFFKSFIAWPLNIRSLRKIVRLMPLLFFHAMKRQKNEI
jgi:glycosyltransferase involved in cell wall biosynthesis